MTSRPFPQRAIAISLPSGGFINLGWSPERLRVTSGEEQALVNRLRDAVAHFQEAYPDRVTGDVSGLRSAQAETDG